MRRILTLCITSLIPLFIYAQSNKIQVGDLPDQSSSIVQIDSNDRGVLFPRMTEAEMLAISNPTEGLLVYLTDLNGFYYYIDPLNGWIHINSIEGFFTINDAVDFDTDLTITEKANTDEINISVEGNHVAKITDVNFDLDTRITIGNAGAVVPQEGMIKYNSGTSDLLAYVNGAWKSITYDPTTVDQFITIHNTTFKSNTNAHVIVDLVDDITLVNSSGMGVTENYLLAPVQLPHGASLTEITYSFKDIDPDADLRIGLWKESLGSPSSLISEHPTFISKGTLGHQSKSLAVSGEVNNEIYSYFIMVRAVDAVNTNIGDQWNGDALGIGKIKIQYQLN